MNVDQKLDLFLKSAMDDAVAHKEQVLADLDAHYRKACDDYRREAETNAKKRLKDEYFKALRVIKNKEIIQAATESKKSLIDLRNQFYEDIFKNVEAKLLDFTQSAEYAEYLVNGIGKAAEGLPDAEAYLLPDHLKLVAGKKALARVALKNAEEDFWGGFRIKSGGLVIDNTFKTRFAEERRSVSMFKIV
ncbi:MAG: hypothetical protein LBU36_02075 [Clostridiales bacterium]|nr:hypothetical protein [Clostridiales bacterium]